MADGRAYRGELGRTRKDVVHFTCPCGTLTPAEVYRSVDAGADPELGARLCSSDAEAALNTVSCPEHAALLRIDLAVIYHDPARELFALVLPESSRHRELEERAALLGALAADPAPIPTYVRDFAVVFGTPDLSALIAEQERAVQARATEHERDPIAEQARDALEAQRTTLEARAAELERLAQELERRRAELDARARDLDVRESRLGAVQADEVHTARQSALDRSEDRTQVVTRPERTVGEDDYTNPFTLFDEADELFRDTAPTQRTTIAEVEGDLDRAPTALIRRGPDTERGMPAHDPEVARWIESGRASCMILDGRGAVRACVMATSAQAEMLAAELDVRFQLHRVPSFPLIVVAIGSPQSLSGQGPEPLAIPLGVEDDRAVMTALAREFSFALEVYDGGHALRRARQVTAPLEDNVRWVVAQAESHLHGIAAAQRSFERALVAWCSPEHDRYGWKHPERSELREDKLVELATARGVRRALAIANRFSSPRREEYLFMLRGYPMALWQSQRRAVLARAIELGIWMGPRLAPIAVSEGLARSHADLVMRMRESFAALCDGAEANDLDADAISDNRAALEAEAAGLGVAQRDSSAAPRAKRLPRTTPIDSALEPVVSGTIHGAAQAVARSSRNVPVDELIADLARNDRCVEAAIELARRREVRAIPAVMSALARLPRIDAVRVLAATPGFGDAVTGALIEGLGSHKSFVRQGCALALAVVRSESALEALSDHILVEPTAVWREIARGMGMAGASAVLPLVSRLARAEASTHERIAWALAHITACGARTPIETLARGRDPVAAAVARHALELTSMATSDVLEVRGHHTPRDQTVNRAFSRRFFQLLDSTAPQVSATAVADPTGRSKPAMMLDEADLLEATDDDVAELLDENDLIPT